MKAISIKQPWAWAIIHGGKDIENRTWRTTFRGRVMIHASLKPDKNAPDELWDMLPEEAPVFGGIIGSVEIVDCVDKSDSKWFTGPYGFVLRNPEPCEFARSIGALGFFEPKEKCGECGGSGHYLQQHGFDDCGSCDGTGKRPFTRYDNRDQES